MITNIILENKISNKDDTISLHSILISKKDELNKFDKEFLEKKNKKNLNNKK